MAIEPYEEFPEVTLTKNGVMTFGPYGTGKKREFDSTQEFTAHVETVEGWIGLLDPQ